MAFTDEQLKKINYLRSSVRLQAPDTETDPVYQFTDEDLYGILDVVTPAHDPDYEIDTLPKKEFYFVVLLAKKEIYYRLATSTAPFYPLSAEGAKLEKNVRFDHYLALIKAVQDEYEAMGGDKSSGDDGGESEGTIQSYQSLLYGKPYLRRYQDMSESPGVELTLSGVLENSVNLDWTKYDMTRDNHFTRYVVYYGTAPIYDEYNVIPMDARLKANFVIEDVRRTKLRISGLLPDTEYFFLVKVETRIGVSGYVQKSVRTKAEVLADVAE